jgi:hypothetical protein
VSARVSDGWLVVPYDGDDRATVEISVQPNVWLPAYLDYADGQRVAKVRPPAGLTAATVSLRINGTVSTAGWLTSRTTARP